MNDKTPGEFGLVPQDRGELQRGTDALVKRGLDLAHAIEGENRNVSLSPMSRDEDKSVVMPDPWAVDLTDSDLRALGYGKAIPLRCVVIRWLKKVGDRVRSGEPLFDAETDVATLQIDAPANGALVEIRVRDGQVIPVNTVVGVIAAVA